MKSKRNEVATDKDWVEASITDEIISANSVRQAFEAAEWIANIIELECELAYDSGIEKVSSLIAQK